MSPATKSSVQPEYNAIAHGRALLLEYDCGSCHGGGSNPAATGFLSGARPDDPGLPIGACAMDPEAKPCMITRPRNLTPDDETGLGRYTERQIFNSLRFGLRPSETPDVTITSDVPGEGNFPANPKYLAPSMPWTAWRHMSDQELMAIVVYLKRGVKPVSNKVAPSDAPPDAWASVFAVENIGRLPAAAFPTSNEIMPDGASGELRNKILRGRLMVIRHACADCHGGQRPEVSGWLAGSQNGNTDFRIGPFITRPRNLTPDNTTGMGRFTERQIFNALRYGLRPGETPDMEITSSTPGEGNFPVNPKYLAPPMPWPGWRHMSDNDLWAIAAYLKHGVKPVRNRVPDSDGPPDFWMSAYTPENIGPYPAVAFPTANEVSP